jgi:hypothetical protein
MVSFLNCHTVSTASWKIFFFNKKILFPTLFLPENWHAFFKRSCSSDCDKMTLLFVGNLTKMSPCFNHYKV